MADIALLLSNSRPAATEGVYEHMFPDKGPRWRFARRYDMVPAVDAALADVGGDASALLLHAAPHAMRVGEPAPGPVALWVVLTNAVEGKDAEFNAWYDTRHIQDTLDIPGIIGAQRFRVTAAAGAESVSPWAYLTLYEIELDRVAESLAEAAARAGGPKMPNPGYLAPGTAALPFRPTA